MGKLSLLLLKKDRLSEAESFFEKCVEFIDKSSQLYGESILLECAYELAMTFFKQGTYSVTKVFIISFRKVRKVSLKGRMGLE
jgi:hypothetical protein